MKATGAVWVAAALAAGVAIGRVSAPGPPHEDPATLDSFRQAFEERDWLERSHRMAAFLRRLGPDDLPEALAAVEARRAWLGAEEIRLFMLAWARFDAPGAFERALAWPGRSQRQSAGAAIYAWAYYDAEAAQRALDEVEDEQLRDFLRTRLVAGWVRSDQKESANRYIASLPDGAQRDSFAGMLARELNEEGSDAVMRWAEGIPEMLPSYKRAAFRKACAAVTASDPRAAVAWVATHAGRDYAEGSHAIIAGRWASADPQAALEWLVELPRDAERDRAIADAFNVWLGFATEPAKRWLRAATPREGLDEAVRVVVRRTNQEGSPGAAFDWAARIDDPRVRDDVTVALGRAWLRREPDAARSWLERSGLPEELRSAITESKGVARTSAQGESGIE